MLKSKTRFIIQASILLTLLTIIYLLPNQNDDQDHPWCFVNPHDVANKTSMQTSESVVEDIKLECTGMSKYIMRKCKIPKVLHSVVTGGSFKFHHYMSLKSISERIRPDMIFLHGYDFPYDSPYFNQTIHEFNIQLVASRNVTKVFNNTVGHLEHKSDVIRLESLIRFGGMYFDLDVYALKDVDALLKGDHEFVIAPENNYGLNNGVMMSKRCARFPLQWYEEYRNFNDSEWSALSIQKPKQIYEELKGEIIIRWWLLYQEIYSDRLDWLPNLIFVDKSLSSDYGSGILFRKEEDTPKEFWTDIRLVHAFWRDHKIEYNRTSVQQLNSTLGRFARELFQD